MKDNKVKYTLIICTTVILLGLGGYFIYTYQARVASVKKAELKQRCLTTYNERRAIIEKAHVVAAEPLSSDPTFRELSERGTRIYRPGDTPESRKDAQDQYDKCLKDLEAIK